VIVVAVEDFGIDAGRRHSARQQAKLSGHILLRALNEHFPFRDNSDASGLERRAGGNCVREQEMGDAATVDYPSACPRDAHPGAAQGLSHLGNSAGSILQGDRQILRGS